MTGAEQMKDWMRRRGFTQADAARYLEWTEPYLSKLLSGDGNLGLRNALKLERLTGIPVEAWASTDLDETATEFAAGIAKRRVSK